MTEDHEWWKGQRDTSGPLPGWWLTNVGTWTAENPGLLAIIVRAMDRAEAWSHESGNARMRNLPKYTRRAELYRSLLDHFNRRGYLTISQTKTARAMLADLDLDEGA